MEKQFTTYEIALKLKELGFDEPCFGYKTKNDHFSLKLKTTNSKLNKQVLDYLNKYKSILPEMVACPLWEQVIDWFREEHQIYIGILPYRNQEDDIELCWYYTLVEDNEELDSILMNDVDLGASDNYDTPEEARLQAINKAIEIVKKRQEDNHVN